MAPCKDGHPILAPNFKAGVQTSGFPLSSSGRTSVWAKPTLSGKGVRGYAPLTYFGKWSQILWFYAFWKWKQSGWSMISRSRNSIDSQRSFFVRLSGPEFSRRRLCNAQPQKFLRWSLSFVYPEALRQVQFEPVAVRNSMDRLTAAGWWHSQPQGRALLQGLRQLCSWWLFMYTASWSRRRSTDSQL